MTASVCGCVCVTCVHVCVRGEGLCVWPSVNLSSCVYMCRQHIWPGAWRSTCKEVTCFPSVDEQPADRLDSRFQFEKKRLLSGLDVLLFLFLIRGGLVQLYFGGILHTKI